MRSSAKQGLGSRKARNKGSPRIPFPFPSARAIKRRNARLACLERQKREREAIVELRLQGRRIEYLQMWSILREFGIAT